MRGGSQVSKHIDRRCVYPVKVLDEDERGYACEASSKNAVSSRIRRSGLPLPLRRCRRFRHSMPARRLATTWALSGTACGRGPGASWSARRAPRARGREAQLRRAVQRASTSNRPGSLNLIEKSFDECCISNARFTGDREDAAAAAASPAPAHDAAGRAPGRARRRRVSVRSGVFLAHAVVTRSQLRQPPGLE